MIWEIDGYSIEILIAEGDSTLVKQWDEEAKIVCVPALASKDEVLWIVRNLLRDGPQIDVNFAVDRLEVFGKAWPMKVSRGEAPSYMKDGIIYTFSKRIPIAKARLHAIKLELLKKFVLDEVGKWEQILDKLIVEVGFRKLPASWSISHHEDMRLTIDSNLVDQQQDIIAYCVFMAIDELLCLEETYFTDLLKKHFPNYYHYEKILQHEAARPRADDEN